MELLFLILFIAAIYYWFNGIRAKELATWHAKAACKKVLLEFLDDTVAIKKVRLRRNVLGRLLIYREYRFEFSSTGEHRYKGQIRLLGSDLINVEMEPYKFHENEDLFD